MKGGLEFLISLYFIVMHRLRRENLELKYDCVGQ